MKLVADTNRIMAAILKDGTSRDIILFSGIEFFTPEKAMGEILKYKRYLSEKSGLDEENIDILLEFIMERITIVPESEIKPHIKKASEIMEEIDKDDALFLACAFAVNADGIWSHDGHFAKQKAIKTYTNSDLLGFLKK